DAAFGTNLLFRLAEMPAFVLHVEICEDLWVPAPPSSFAALAGASVIGNLSASNIIVGKEGYRHQLVANQSPRCLAAYLDSAARRCTASRCRASSPACRRRAPRSSSSASPAGWIPPRRSSSARARSTS